MPQMTFDDMPGFGRKVPGAMAGRGPIWIASTLAMIAVLSAGWQSHVAQDEDDTVDCPPPVGSLPGATGNECELKTDLPYGENVAQRLDVYTPRGARGAPVMVYVHGGGWSKGDKKATGQKASFFASNGWVLVSIKYRLLPEGRHPHNVQDTARALAWVHREIGRYGGDPESVFLMGHSAGCHLASLAATDERWLIEAGSSLAVIRGVIALDTQAYDIAKLMATRSTALYRQVFGEDPKVHKDASPFHRIAGDRNIPPFLARDFAPSPFPEEADVLYACGFNGSCMKGSLGTAWVYRGELLRGGQPGSRDAPGAK
jgi:acetyl esterase/lipase